MRSETDLVGVKTERESNNEVKREIGLYAEHEIKEEMVIGPVVLQRAACNYSTNCSEEHNTSDINSETNIFNVKIEKEIYQAENQINLCTEHVTSAGSNISNMTTESESKVFDVKTETESEDEAESETHTHLYREHVIKEELVIIAPVRLQPAACNYNTYRSRAGAQAPATLNMNVSPSTAPRAPRAPRARGDCGEPSFEPSFVVKPVTRTYCRLSRNSPARHILDAPLLNKPRLETEDNKADQVKLQEEMKGNGSGEINSNVDLNKDTSADVRTREVKHKGLTKNYNQRKCNKPYKLLKNVNIFICNDCGKYFAKKWSLAAHIATHKKIKQDDNLMRHLRIVTGNKPYSCSICEYKCKQKHHLVRHLWIHSSEKPYSCSMCDYKSSDKDNMARHLRIHTGVKPYSSSLCEYKSTEKINVTRHLRIHNSENPYSCSYSEYNGNKRTDLTSHLRIHTGEIYSCSLCGFNSTKKSSLTSHLRIHLLEKLF